MLITIPNITIELRPREADLLRLELEALSRESALYDAAAALELLSQARGEPQVVDLTPALEPICTAIARAIDHLAEHAPSLLDEQAAAPFPGELRRLRDAARGYAGLAGSATEYVLLEDGWKSIPGFVSYTGAYDAGDRLVIPGGSPFQVKHVDVDAEGRARLTIYHQPEPQGVTFHILVDGDVRVVSVSPTLSKRLAEELRARGYWLLGAHVRLATQLHSSTTFNVLVGDEHELLDALEILGSMNGGSAGARLERALRARVDEARAD